MAWVSMNNYLTADEVENNVNLIYSFLTKRGWTKNAICGMVGNMVIESTVNPGIWENLDKGNMSVGFGLVQWTPATNFTNWADSKGYAWTDGDAQLTWIDEETVNKGQWIEVGAYPLSFEEFKKSTATPEYLASAFLKNFERAGVEAEASRQSYARQWFEYLGSGETTDPETPVFPSIPSKRKKFNFILFNKQRRFTV